MARIPFAIPFFDGNFGATLHLKAVLRTAPQLDSQPGGEWPHSPVEKEYET